MEDQLLSSASCFMITHTTPAHTYHYPQLLYSAMSSSSTASSRKDDEDRTMSIKEGEREMWNPSHLQQEVASGLCQSTTTRQTSKANFFARFFQEVQPRCPKRALQFQLLPPLHQSLWVEHQGQQASQVQWANLDHWGAIADFKIQIVDGLCTTQFTTLLFSVIV